MAIVNTAVPAIAAITTLPTAYRATMSPTITLDTVETIASVAGDQVPDTRRGRDDRRSARSP